MPWFLYLIECNDDSIYTGIAIDVAARYAQHERGTGARYTRSRRPRRLLASFELPDRASASKAEYRVKRLSAAQKRALADGLLVLTLRIEPEEGGDAARSAIVIAPAA